ncbi:MAG TPA: hypothetical protein VK671_04090 [Mucilaginibacter sp.]|nr:hypothetical protein [Mucilaginibacter sp.]
MKKSILKFAVFLLLLSVVFVACKKSNEIPSHVNHGVITQDFGECPICGGYFVKFDTDTSVIYRTLQDLTNFGVTVNSKFPIKATIGWKTDTAIKVPHYITITSLKIDH